MFRIRNVRHRNDPPAKLISVSGLRLGFVETGLLYMAALLVGLTRMYVGAHYPRDVIGGFFFASAAV